MGWGFVMEIILDFIMWFKRDQKNFQETLLNWISDKQNIIQFMQYYQSEELSYCFHFNLSEKYRNFIKR